MHDAFNLKHFTFCKLDVAYFTGMSGLYGVRVIQDGDLAAQFFFLSLNLFGYPFDTDVSVFWGGLVTNFAQLFVFFLRNEGMVDGAILIN